MIHLLIAKTCVDCKKVHLNNFELLILLNLLGLDRKQIFTATHVSKMRTQTQINTKDFFYKIVKNICKRIMFLSLRIYFSEPTNQHLFKLKK